MGVHVFSAGPEAFTLPFWAFICPITKRTTKQQKTAEMAVFSLK
jgi:hypothetical protein